MFILGYIVVVAVEIGLLLAVEKQDYKLKLSCCDELTGAVLRNGLFQIVLVSEITS